MSGQALIWAANVRGLKATTKIVLIQLAERHNKDTKLCNPSIKTLADDCEMDRSTVIRHLEMLEGFGLLTRVRKGKEDGGRASNEYLLHIPDQVKTDVGERVKSQSATGVKSQSATGVKSQNDGGLSRKTTGVKSHSYATRTCLEPDSEPDLFGSKEPHNARDSILSNTDVGDAFERLWKEFPKRGKKDKGEARKKFEQVVKSGADPEKMVSAAKHYSDWLDSGGPKDFRPNPKHLSTWLNKGCWDDEFQEDKPARTHRLRENWAGVER